MLKIFEAKTNQELVDMYNEWESKNLKYYIKVVHFPEYYTPEGTMRPLWVFYDYKYNNNSTYTSLGKIPNDQIIK